MLYTPEHLRSHAISFEDAQWYAQYLREFSHVSQLDRTEQEYPATGGTLEHFHPVTMPVRQRFRDSAHGKHGRKPRRLKGEASIRRLVPVHA